MWIDPATGHGHLPQPAIAMKTVKYGAGLKPAAPDPVVGTLQVKLGINPADGRFGNDTKKQVIAFQRKNNLVPDGIVGPLTWQVLFPVVRPQTVAPTAPGWA
jgi:peptidoglycan hydrolase-like protein with peptidoglycan-binding domain